MMISTKGRYALRVMMELASRGGGYVPLKELAQNQGISEKYLEVIMKSLVKEGFLLGLRGKGGGYRLSRPASDFTAGEILRAMEGSLAPVACLAPDAPPCPRRDSCPTLPMWKEFHWLTEHFFEGKTLEQLAANGAPILCPK